MDGKWKISSIYTREKSLSRVIPPTNVSTLLRSTFIGYHPKLKRLLAIHGETIFELSPKKKDREGNTPEHIVYTHSIEKENSFKLKQTPTSLCVNQHIDNKLEFCVGYSNGDLSVISTHSASDSIHKPSIKHFKEGNLTNSVVTCIVWLNDSVFIVGLSDGQILMLDKNREDPLQPIDPEDSDVNNYSNSNDIKSFTIVNNKNEAKMNPISRYILTKGVPVTSIDVSSSKDFMAVVSEDGYLRVFYLKLDKLLFVCKSYYGGVLSVTFSPDSKYICVGGEDDMIHIYSLSATDLKLLARGQGHNSWINKVIFDPHPTSSLSYSIYSVGQDGNLCIWEFSPEFPITRQRRSSLLSSSGGLSTSTNDIIIPVNTSTIVVPTLLNKDIQIIDPQIQMCVLLDPLTDILICDKYLILCGGEGSIKVFMRQQNRNQIKNVS